MQAHDLDVGALVLEPGDRVAHRVDRDVLLFGGLVLGVEPLLAGVEAGEIAPVEVTTSVAGDRGVAATIAVDPASGRMRIAPAAIVTGGRSAELWIIPADGKPRSLGVFDPAAPSRRNSWAACSSPAAPR